MALNDRDAEHVTAALKGYVLEVEKKARKAGSRKRNPWRLSEVAMTIAGAQRAVEKALDELGFDTKSPASSQHYVDTGRYLRKGEAESDTHVVTRNVHGRVVES